MDSFDSSSKKLRVLQQDELPRLCAELFSLGQKVPLVITGSSMEPFLKEGRDEVLLCPPEKLRTGDVALFRRSGGRMILHRIVSEKNGAFWFCGDNQTRPEGPIERGQIVAVAAEMIRDGKKHWHARSVRWLFYRYIWRWLRPLRPAAARCLHFLKGGRP